MSNLHQNFKMGGQCPQEFQTMKGNGRIMSLCTLYQNCVMSKQHINVVYGKIPNWEDNVHMHLTEKFINGRIMYMVTHYVISGGLNPLRLNNTLCTHIRGRKKYQENSIRMTR